MNKYCNRCQQTKPENEFYECSKKNIYCKTCCKYLTVKRQREYKLKCLEYLGNVCSKCGYNKYAEALDFHHIDPANKKFSIAQFRKKDWKRNKDIIIAELNKCVILCANCHRELHRVEYEALPPLKPKIKPTKKCPFCSVDFNSDRKFCSMKCYRLASRKVNRPTKEELELLISKHSFCELGRMYHVSDNAVRKWCRHYRIST